MTIGRCYTVQYIVSYLTDKEICLVDGLETGLAELKETFDSTDKLRLYNIVHTDNTIEYRFTMLIW